MHSLKMIKHPRFCLAISTLIGIVFIWAIGVPSKASGISVQINGNPLALDQPPIVQEGRTLVPLRAIFEALGAEVEWDASNKLR